MIEVAAAVIAGFIPFSSRPLPSEEIGLEVRNTVEKKMAVEMIHFVLKGESFESARGHRARRSVLVEIRDLHFELPAHVGAQIGNGQTSFPRELSSDHLEK